MKRKKVCRNTLFVRTVLGIPFLISSSHYRSLKLLEIKNRKAAEYALTSPIYYVEQYIPFSVIACEPFSRKLIIKYLVVSAGGGTNPNAAQRNISSGGGLRGRYVVSSTSGMVEYFLVFVSPDFEFFQISFFVSG